VGISDIRPFFLSCTRTQSLTAWAGIFANFTIILWCAAWIISHYHLAELSTSSVILDLLLALFLADLFSGFVHWGTDTWFDEISWERTILIAREHHLYPHHIVGYGFRDYVAFSSWPIVVTIGPLVAILTLALAPSALAFDAVGICLIVATVMVFGTYAHRLGHQKTDTAVVVLLQKAHLLMSPRHHGVHHRDNHDIRYCVINGWANHLCDRIGFWRALERLIEWTTGSVARSNDHEWFRRFETDRLCLTTKSHLSDQPMAVGSDGIAARTTPTR
jgi:hypothetical protein